MSRRSGRGSLFAVLLVMGGSLVACESVPASPDADTARDGGRPDSGLMNDGGSPVRDAGPPRDAGSPTRDGGSPTRDAGTDAGNPPLPDAGPITCSTPDTWYRDLDGDGHGDATVSLESCDPISGFVLSDDDCNDACATCHPSAAEVCDAMDNDCDGDRDETQLCVPGEMVACTASCGSGGMGLCTATCQIPTGSACTPPMEICNGMDEDCDGAADDGFACSSGAPTVCTTSCGTTGTGTCSASCGLPSAAMCNPPAESCNGMDDDCDGTRDEGFTCAVGDSVSCTTSCGTTGTGRCTGACNLPTGAACNPPAEVCNGQDDDCNGVADNGFACVRNQSTSCTTTCGSIGVGTCSSSCTTPVPSACTAPPETCNYTDDDCDGAIDEGTTQLGPAHDVGGATVDMPHVAANSHGQIAIWRAGTQNYLTRLNPDGTAILTMNIEGTADFDLEASSGGFVYSYVQVDGDVRVIRLEDVPTVADPYLWSIAINTNAAHDVHIAMGSGHAYVWYMDSAGPLSSAYFRPVRLSDGAVSPHVIAGPGEHLLDATSNGATRHAAAWGNPEHVYFREFNHTSSSSDYLGLELASVTDLRMTGLYDGSAFNGLLMAYYLPSSGELRYFSYDPAGGNKDRLIASRAAGTLGNIRPADLRQDGTTAYLATVETNTQLFPVAITSFDVDLYELRPTINNLFEQRELNLTPASTDNVFLGAALSFRPGTATTNNRRIFYQRPTGGGFTSHPIGCY